MIKTIRDVYKKGHNDEIEVFTSMRYNMTPLTIFERELKKTFYLEDKTEQLKQVRALLNAKDETPTIQETQASETQNEGGLFYGTWVALGYVRELEIENYLQSIFNEAENRLKTSKYIAVCYLIDEQFKTHSGVLDSIKHDANYRNEYNALIFEVLQGKIYEIAQKEYEPIDETLPRIIKKPLYWNAKKSSIGTLFGMLHDANIIQGSKVDVIRSLGAMFSNLSESTLKDNINLKLNSNDNKTLYDVKTENKAKDWIDYLKPSTTN